MNRLMKKSKRCEFCCRAQEEDLKVYAAEDGDRMNVCDHCFNFLVEPVLELCLADFDQAI